MSDQQNILIQSSGTFTPEIQFGGATTGITYSSRSGFFVKTGNVINFSISISLSNKGSATGDMTIDGLPFTNSATSGHAATVAGNLILDASYDTFKAIVDASATTVSILQEGSNVVPLSVDDASFNNTTFIAMTGAYFI